MNEDEFVLRKETGEVLFCTSAYFSLYLFADQLDYLV